MRTGFTAWKSTWRGGSTLKMWVLAALLAGSLAACSDPRRRAEKALAGADPRALRHDAAVIYKDLFGPSAKAAFVSVPAETWPRSFGRFAPRRITAYRDGLALTVDPSADRESGLYVVPEGLEHAPRQTERASFERLREGVYWYEFGRRGQ